MTAHFPNPPDVISGVVDYTPRRSVYREYLKRAFDIVFVLLASVLILPLVVILATLIMLNGASPFYIQPRIGKDGRTFNMIKLRTMVPDADRKLSEYLHTNPEARDEWIRTQKLRHDPRITTVGRILRKTSLDELPQFLNVLLGDMSVVGPRPMMPTQRDLYPGQAYYALRPGVTGLWQVGDRNETSFAARARYDADYYKISTFQTDLAVIAKTIKVVMRGTGV